MDWSNANETDVREELAAPFLATLGYFRGSPNDIRREHPLRYDKSYLGRKKSSDPPLRGRADYVLVVTGVSRWVLEIKAPSEDLNDDVIDQVLSYARHPEVGAAYAAFLNGKRFVLYRGTAGSDQEPIADIPVHSAEELAEKLESLLSPSAIRRDCGPPRVDLGKPLASGFHSSASVTGGFVRYKKVIWQCDFHIPQPQKAEMDEITRRLQNYRSIITGGSVWRDNSSRILSKLIWTAPSDELLKFALDKNLMDAEYVSLDEVVSSDAENPTLFDVTGGLTVSEGESLFDIVRWTSQTAEMAMSVTYSGQALGTIHDSIFSGEFISETRTAPSLFPDFQVRTYSLGDFEVALRPD